MASFKLLFAGVAIGVGQVAFLDYLKDFGYLAFAPTVVAIFLIWKGLLS